MSLNAWHPGHCGGKLKYYWKEWVKYTSDKFVLSCIRGCKINFISSPIQRKMPHPLRLNQEQELALSDMVQKFVEDKVILKCDREEGDYVNNIFLREKKNTDNGKKKYRMILNVKHLNTHVEYVHFKMDSLDSCLNLMEDNCFMASIDLADAYHSIPMYTSHTKFLKFEVKGQLYKYLVLPQGYRDSPRIFTKITKPLIAHLHERGILCSIYIDDLYVQGSTFEECKTNVTYAVKILESVGFDISPKSRLTPHQNIEHLGFLLNSKTMTVSLGISKRDHVKLLIQQLLSSNITVRDLAQVIGTLVASFPAVEYGRLFYRQLEMLKTQTLRNAFNYDKQILLTQEARDELRWWTVEGIYSSRPLVRENPCMLIRTDASSFAWGAEMNGEVSHGMWSDKEKDLHINVLELQAALLGIQSLCHKLRHCHLRIELDNTTAVAYINNMGGTHSVACNAITKTLLLWCKARGIWLSACHIPGKDNTVADSYSRKQSIHTEWSLNVNVFSHLCEIYGTPSIDLFAARTNNQLPRYMSLYPDASAEAINAFLHVWDEYVYIFPPFNLIPRVLKKLREDRTKKALIVVPEWKTQTWFPKLNSLMTGQPFHLKPSKTLLRLPSDSHAVHPLHRKLRLMACTLSGRK